ncbi:MAG: glycosyltransferase family 4 protein, partial [Phototrophicales bacterium]
LSSGGAERVTANLANHWAKKGWEVTVVTLSDGVDDFYELESSVRRIKLAMLQESSSFAMGLVNNLRRLLALRGLLKEINPHVALGMMENTNILLSLAAKSVPNIVAVGSEHTHPPQLPLSRIWEVLRGRYYAHLGAVSALTTDTRDWLLRHTSVKKVAVIPNPVPWPLPAQNPSLLPRTIVPPGKKLLLAVGRLTEEKGFDLLIDAFGRIASLHPDWHLVILGDGPLRSSLTTQIKKVNMGDRITLAGIAGNIGDWYQAADLYVMSSRVEGFGNTLAEALAYGVPSISFDCDVGPRGIIRHEVDGLLVNNGDVGALSEALDRLMHDELLRQRMGVRAIEARERFAIERVAGMWERLFAELLVAKKKGN